MTARISIVTPTFNSARTLPDTLRALEQQSHAGLEYIVVDGGSTDGTLDLLRHSPTVTRWISERDHGVYDAMNKGIRMATGDLIGIINSDDYYLDGALTTVARAAQAHPDAHIFYGDQMYERQDGSVVRNRQKHPIAATDFWRMPVNTATVFVRRECYERVGVFDLRYHVSADCDLFLRLIKAGCRFEYVEGPLAYTRSGGLSDRYYFDAHVERVKILVRQRADAATVLRALNRLARYPVMSARTGRAFRRP